MADLLINGRDAYKTWGVRMGDKFLDVLGASLPMKEFIENKSRLEHGKRVIINNPKIDERFFVKFGGNLFFISTVSLFFFLNPIKSCRYVCFLVTLKTPHH